MIIQLGPITIDNNDIGLVLGKLDKVNKEDMKNKECDIVSNIVLRENSYIDIVQTSSDLSALKFYFCSFFVWQIILLLFKLCLYKILDYDIVWLRYPLLIVIFGVAIITLLFSNMTFLKCFSRKRLQGIVPIASKCRFTATYNWYANAIIGISTIVNFSFVFILSFYDECFSNLKIARDSYVTFDISDKETVLAFVDDALTNLRHTGILLECCYLFVFAIIFIFLIAIFYVARIAKPVIFTADVNRSSKDVCDTIKPDGISIIKQSSEVIPLDLLNEKLTFLFDAVIVFDYLSKDLIVYRSNVIQRIDVKEVNRCTQIVYNSNLKRWVVR